MDLKTLKYQEKMSKAHDTQFREEIKGLISTF